MLIFCQDLQTSLNNMITVYIDWELINIVFDGLWKDQGSLIGQRVEVVQEFLQGPGTMLVHGDLDEVCLDGVKDLVNLSRFCDFYQFLAEIVGKLVDHENREKLIKYD